MTKKPTNAIKGKQGFQKTGRKDAVTATIPTNIPNPNNPAATEMKASSGQIGDIPWETRVNAAKWGDFMNGYITVPPNHPWYGKGEEDAALRKINVHGGISYAQATDDGNWKIGFDTAYPMDRKSQVAPQTVLNETHYLAHQANELLPTKK